MNIGIFIDITCNKFTLIFCSGWVTLGKPRSDNTKGYIESGFQGHLTKVQVWSRALDVTNEIQKQVSSGLHLQSYIDLWYR